MQQYYKHIQAKYSPRTSLQAPEAKSSPRPTSALSSISFGSPSGNVKRNSVDFMHMQTLLKPKHPAQRIGKFSHPKKAWQNPESNSNCTTATTIYNNVSEDHNYHPKYLNHYLPDAAEGHRHPKLSGNALPKWNHLYKAYNGQGSS